MKKKNIFAMFIKFERTNKTGFDIVQKIMNNSIFEMFEKCLLYDFCMFEGCLSGFTTIKICSTSQKKFWGEFLMI